MEPGKTAGAARTLIVIRLMRFALRAFGVALLMLLASSAGLAADDIGRILLSNGNAVAERGGQAIELRSGDPVRAGDVLRTGPGGPVQIQRSGRGIIAVGENSQVSLEAGGDQPGAVNLTRGGYRFVSSGAETHESRSGGTTIVVREASYASFRVCQGNCGAGVADGLYANISSRNPVIVTNASGSRSMTAGGVFHVANADSPAAEVARVPSIIAVPAATEVQNALVDVAAQLPSIRPIAARGFQFTETLTSDGRSAVLQSSPLVVPIQVAAQMVTSPSNPTVASSSNTLTIDFTGPTIRTTGGSASFASFSSFGFSGSSTTSTQRIITFTSGNQSLVAIFPLQSSSSGAASWGSFNGGVTLSGSSGTSTIGSVRIYCPTC